MVLNSIESWCKKNKEKIYCLSTDGDFLSFKSKNLIHIEEYDKLLNSITHTYSEANIFDKIEKAFEKFEEDIVLKVEDVFETELQDEGFDSSYGFEFHVKSVEHIRVVYLDHSVLSFYDNEAIVESTFKVSYSMEVEYEDLNTGFYDKEDGVYYGVETSDKIVSDDVILTAKLIIHYDLPGRPAIWNWDFEGITDGLPISISLE